MRWWLPAALLVAATALELVAQDTPATAPATQPATQPAKSPVPDAASQARALALLKEQYKDDYARPAARPNLLAKLAIFSGTADLELPVRYVSLDEVRRLAAETGDVVLAAKSLEQLSQMFEGNFAALESRTLSDLTKSIRNVEAARTLVSLLLDRMNNASAAESWDEARRALDDAQLILGRFPDPAVAPQVIEARKAMAAPLEQHLRLAPIRKRLEQNPGDAQANLQLGQHLCFTRSRWDLGLPYLVKGSDAEFKAVAELDLLNPSEPIAQAAVGDRWYALGSKRAPLKASVFPRAAYWYSQSVENLTGVQKEAVTRRLAEMGDLARNMRTVVVGTLAVPWREGLLRDVAPSVIPMSVAIADQGRQLAILTQANVQFYDIASDRIMGKLDLAAGRHCHALCLSADRRMMLVGSDAGATIFNLQTGEQAGHWTPPAQARAGTYFLTGANRAMTLLSDGTLADLTKNQVIPLDAAGRGFHPPAIIFSANGSRLISLESDKNRTKSWVRILATDTGRMIGRADVTPGATALLLTGDPRTFAVYSTAGKSEDILSLHTLDTGAMVARHVFMARSNAVHAFVGKDQVLLSDAGKIVLVSLKQQKIIQTLGGVAADCKRAIITTDGRFAVIWHADDRIRIWGLLKGER